MKILKSIRSKQGKKRLRVVVNLAIPSGLNSFFDILVIGICLFFMGRIDDNHVLAVSISLNFFTLAYAFTTIFYVGTNAQIARLFGAKILSNIPKVTQTMAVGGFISALPITLLGLLSSFYYFQWLDLSAEANDLATTFMSILMLSFPSTMLKTIIIASFAAIGNTIYPLIIRIISAIVVTILCYGLVFGIDFLGIPPLGIIGAGVALLVGAYLELILFLAFWFRSKLLFKISKFDWSYFAKGLKIGVPTGVERFLILFAIVFISKLYSNYGDLALAGSQVGARIEAFSFMPTFGFMVAAMVLMGQSIGSGKLKLARIYTQTIIIFSSVIMGISGILLIVFGNAFSEIFSSDPEVIKSSYAYLIAVGLSQIPLAWIFVYDGALRGAGMTKTALFLNVGSIWFLRILPMGALVYINAPLWTLYAIICIETFLRAFIFRWFFNTNSWQKAPRIL
ncbi:MAG: MATE family efflux transporter [Helicobacter sp.]|nr:MATE family efflux transporter [Helicobacter sp.]